MTTADNDNMNVLINCLLSALAGALAKLTRPASKPSHAHALYLSKMPIMLKTIPIRFTASLMPSSPSTSVQKSSLYLLCVGVGEMVLSQS